jgi:hypothetical protein
MPSTVLTFTAEIDSARLGELKNDLALLRDKIGKLDCPFARIGSLHFASMTVFDTPGFPPVLVFENNFDGELDPYLDELLGAAAPSIHRVFSHAKDYQVQDASRHREIAGYLRAHVLRPAAYHIGNVGRTVKRIRQETELRSHLAERLDQRLLAQPGPASADECYDLIRQEMMGAGRYEWVTSEPHARQTPSERTAPRRRLQWTVIALVALLIALLALSWWATLAGLILLVVVLLLHEALERPMKPTQLDPNHARRLAEREDQVIQNHLASMTVVKWGVFRRLLLRVVLWGANLIARTSTEGKLSGIPSIHFAHWALLDRGRRLLFLSNFDGSWENYLDDFIDKASPGLTGIWSNTVGFPRTWLLALKGGSRDGVAFKAFARQNQIRADVWYSAYPSLTVTQIDRQSTLREGLASRPASSQLPGWLRCW